MTKPLVSIAICTYNGEKFLVEQLDSIVNQTYANLEFIVVDDQSKDGTLAILKSYSEKYSNFKVYENEVNLGYVKNFEKAIGLCNGEFIALADQDDIWDLEKITIMIKSIGDNILLYHDSEFIAESGETLNRKMSDIRHFYAGNDSRVFLLENCISGHAILFKKELLNATSTFPTNTFHDWWLAYIACNNGKIGFINNCLVNYRQHIKANTNILRENRGVIKKRNALLQMEKEFERLTVFECYPFNNNQPFITKFLALFNSRMSSYFSFSLAFFIYSNRKELLFIQKKSSLSKLNYCLKYAWGYKLKKLIG